MVKAPRFSVVIPVFNRVQQLGECLRSVENQTFRDFETIVVDDGSIEDVAASLGQSGLPIQHLRHAKNRGVGAARNTGMREAKGEYVAFLDSDDTWFPWTLMIYDLAIRQGEQPSFVAGREGSNGEGHLVAPSELKFKRFEDYYHSSTTSIWIGTCATAIRTTALRNLGGFTEDRMNAEDSDLWLRLGTAPGFVQILEPPVFRYHRASGSLVGERALAEVGIAALIANEKAGRYPGGMDRKRERRAIISRHVRPYIVGRLRMGDRRVAVAFYRRILLWLLGEFRLKFLFGFWALFIASLLYPSAKLQKSIGVNPRKGHFCGDL